ncbi:N-acetylmuramoyl-L-alanine amidase family protein [Lachnoclostridium sp. Marseille-P6806]|uniref:N-acetylmuramoyl-L-alanine amidase family protein n=1 Tax=Lachnoclostridium sp. Marseille-P6806 TaxID=2364793 RepID=UPI001030CC35|nr:N-acetylmuramoyl-L-alanine amidase [Lachnoclostridium sp. Marseille-P6806]
MTELCGFGRRIRRLIIPVLAIFAGAAALRARTEPAHAAQAAGGSVVLALDPGHGGPLSTSDHLGAQYAPYSEKAMTLELAQRIEKELSVYDNVNVVLLRTADRPLSLAQRAADAQAAGADFLISLHFNASLQHLSYGTEVWTSAFGSNYSAGASFGRAVLEQTAKLGYYDRGVKTRIGSHGDYYGIIRESAARGIPSALIEHCYLDSSADRLSLGGAGDVEALAKADAAAIARYFHLRSSATGEDYTDYVRPAAVPAGAAGIPQDQTPPDVCRLELCGRDAAGQVICRLTARDTDSVYPVLYYFYSVNGVPTALLPFPRNGEAVVFTVSAPPGAEIVAAAVNSYDLVSVSRPVTVR